MRILGRPIHKWLDNIKINLKNIFLLDSYASGHGIMAACF
jgi:hypothetical protein